MAKTTNVFYRIFRSNERVDRSVEKIKAGESASQSMRLGYTAIFYFALSVVAVFLLPSYARYVIHIGFNYNYAIIGNLFIIVGGILLFFVPLFFALIALLYSKGQCSVNERTIGRLVRVFAQAMVIVVIPATILTAIYLYPAIIG